MTVWAYAMVSVIHQEAYSVHDKELKADVFLHTISGHFDYRLNMSYLVE